MRPVLVNVGFRMNERLQANYVLPEADGRILIRHPRLKRSLAPKRAAHVGAVTAGLLAMSSSAWAACPADVSSGVDVSSGETCVAALSSYANNSALAVLGAIGGGSVLSVTGADVVASGGVQNSSAPVWARSGGVINIVGNLDVTVNGGGSYITAISAQLNGSAIHLGTSTRIVHHGGAVGGGGLVAEMGKSLVTAAGLVTIVTDGAPAILAADGGRLDLKDIDVTVAVNGNPNPNGIFVIGSTSNVTYGNGVINTVGTGMRVIAGGAIVGFGNTGLRTAGDNAFGASSEGAGSSIAINGQYNATTSGVGAFGVVASGGGVVALNGGGLIQTQGINASGIAATGSNSAVTGNQLTVRTLGVGANGVAVTNNGQVSLTSSTIATTGTGAAGMSAASGARITGTNINLSTSGVGANGLDVKDGGTLNLNSSSVAVSGATASALSVSSTLGATQTAAIANSTLASANAPAINAAMGVSSVTLTASTVSGNGVLLNVGSTGIANLSVTANGSRLNGSAFTAAGSRSSVSLANGTAWTLPTNSNVTTLVNANSVVSFAANPIFTTLTVDGNYTGDNGGFRINTALGTDGSPTDLLHIVGDTDGTSTLEVINANGQGAITTADGIKVAQVDGLSDGSFSLLGHYVLDGQQVVVGGAYGYALYKNGVADPADGNWYLRSKLSQNPLNPVQNPVHPVEPIFQAGVPTYEVYPQVLLSLNGLPTLQQRVGNRYWDRNGNNSAPVRVYATGTVSVESDAGSTDVEENGIWGRVEGSHAKVSPASSRTGTDYTLNTARMQAGADGLLAERPDGRLIGGLNVQYDHGTAKTRSFYGDGVISANGYGFGGTLTWYGDAGLYFDGQAHVTWYNSDLSSILASRSLANNNSGFGYAFSLETGQRIALNDSWSIAPQAQLTFSSVNFDAFDDSFGARVSPGRGESLQSRIGLALEHQSSWSDDQGQLNRASLYGIGNLYYEHLDGTTADVASVGFSGRNDRLWGGLGFGGSYNWANDTFSLSGEGLINTSLENFGSSMAYQANIGFRVKW